MKSSRLGWLASRCDLDGQADQAPGRFVVAACYRTDRVHGLLVGGLGLVAVFHAQVAFGAVDDLQALGNRPQVREMVPPQFADELSGWTRCRACGALRGPYSMRVVLHGLDGRCFCQRNLDLR